MSKKDNYEECNIEEKVIYYNSNGLVEYWITNLVKRELIMIPFEYFDQYMEILLNIKYVKSNGFYAHKIVNAEENEGATILFFEELQEIGKKYFFELYNAVWKKVPVSHYKFLLPNIIDNFHIEITECIKEYAKILGIRKNVPENCYSVTIKKEI